MAVAGYCCFQRQTYIPRLSYQREEIEYPGYDQTWVLGREREGYWTDEYHRSPSYSSYDQYYPRYLSQQYPHNSYQGHSGRAHLAWPTEIPVRLRMTICCERCRLKLEHNLRDMHGVHDVVIAGWTNAMVTITGSAPARKLLKTARKISKTAEFWFDSEYPGYDDYSSRHSYRRHH